MINTIIAQVKNRRLFYRGYYIKGLNWLIALLVLEWMVAATAFYVATHRVTPSFYASSSDGILTPLRVMSAPNRGNTPLLT